MAKLPLSIHREIQRIEREADGRGGQHVGPVTYHALRDAIEHELAVARAAEPVVTASSTADRTVKLPWWRT